jgi:hypothetical protein
LRSQLAAAQAAHAKANVKIQELTEEHASLTVSLKAAGDTLASATAERAENENLLQESAATDRAALVQANQHLKRIQAELEALQAEQVAAALAANEKIAELQAQLDVAKSASASLEAEKAALEQEKGELKARVDELDIDVLETKEAADKAIDESTKALAVLKQTHWEEKDALTKGLQEELRVAVEKHEAAAKLWEEQSLETAKAHESDKAAALAEAQIQANAASKAALDGLAAEHGVSISDLEVKHATTVKDLKTLS